MSIEALMWAMNLAPAPCDAGGKPNAAAAAVLIGLANHAGPDGRAAFPSVRVLTRYSRLSEATVRAAIARLARAGIIQPGDPAVVAAYIHRGDRRPQVWNLDMTLVRSDLSDEDLWDIARMNPFLEPLIHRVLTSRNTNGVQQLHPVNAENRYGVQQPDPDVDNQPHGVQQTDPAPVDNPPRGPAATPRGAYGVQQTAPRGPAAGPEPDLKQEEKPPTSSGPPVDNSQEGRRTETPPPGTAEQLAALALSGLPAPWRLDAGTRRRALPELARRIAHGWTVPALVDELTHSPEGVRKPGGVFMRRLADLPLDPPAPPAPAAPAGPPQRCTKPGHQFYELPCRGCIVDAKTAS